jgi:hypothetical protein
MHQLGKSWSAAVIAVATTKAGIQNVRFPPNKGNNHRSLIGRQGSELGHLGP